MSSFSELSGDGKDEGARWLIVGLGNPGDRYARTRHNLGFMVVDEIARRFGAVVKRPECRSLVGRLSIGESAVELVKPQTFMNLSGEAVKCLLASDDERSLVRTLVIVDDLALPLGSIRLRGKGSAGGHNGLRSIIGSTGTDEFIRLRIGIMPEHPVVNTKKFVLDDFPKDEREPAAEAVIRSADAVEAVIENGLQSAMSEFNS